MTWLQAGILGVVQGITEFLPVSSSGHLALLQQFYGFSEPPLFFDIAVHVATLLSLLFFMRTEVGFLAGIIRFDKASLRILGLIMVGTIPAFLVGAFFYDVVKESFHSGALLAPGFILNALILFVPVHRKTDRDGSLSSLSYPRALFIGCGQALSILPSISRSGTTIVAGLAASLNRESALFYSFYLLFPAVLGAQILSFMNESSVSLPSPAVLVAGFFPALLIGYLTLITLRATLVRGKLWYFGLYNLALGVALLLV